MVCLFFSNLILLFLLFYDQWKYKNLYQYFCIFNIVFFFQANKIQFIVYLFKENYNLYLKSFLVYTSINIIFYLSR